MILYIYRNYTENHMIATYIWQHEDWPHFRWDEAKIGILLAAVRHRQGLLLGKLSALGFNVQSNTMLDVMTQDVASSSEIEGVLLDTDAVRSSVARHLGIEVEGLPEPSHDIDGVVQILLDAVKNAHLPLTKERICNWHAALFPHGRSGAWKIVVADWRQNTAPMQVVSGAMGKEKVHYEAPPTNAVPSMMDAFIQWVNTTTTIDPMLKTIIAHLWFVTIHPFEDGNGRIARTITDLLMTRADQIPHRFYSISAAILNDRKSYYDILETTQHGGMDITDWIIWFLHTTNHAIEKTVSTLDLIADKARFWSRHQIEEVNPRQLKIVNRLLDGFNGLLTSSKYAKICHCSADTALRDLNDLVSKGYVEKQGEGRGTHYIIRSMTIKDKSQDEVFSSI